jgi:hypothetical protein
VADPAAQSPDVGVEEKLDPLEEPQSPLEGEAFALQLEVSPPFKPVQFHVHGPVPEIDVAVPCVQRSVTGADVRVALSDPPHVPVTGVASPF